MPGVHVFEVDDGLLGQGGPPLAEQAVEVGGADGQDQPVSRELAAAAAQDHVRQRLASAQLLRRAEE